MKRANSLLLLIVGSLLLVIGIFTTNIYLKYSILFTSIIINVVAAIVSFKEKKNNKS